MSDRPFRDLYDECEGAFRLHRYMQKVYHNLLERYPELMTNDVNLAVYGELRAALEEDLATDGYSLCIYLAAILKYHPQLIDSRGPLTGAEKKRAAPKRRPR